jgi:hypothetical protein
MCCVTRVMNSCGHINDHIEIVYRDAKPVSPIEPGAVLADSTNHPLPSANSRYLDPMKLARPISPGPAARYAQPDVLPLNYFRTDFFANQHRLGTGMCQWHRQPMKETISMEVSMPQHNFIVRKENYGFLRLSICRRNTRAW